MRGLKNMLLNEQHRLEKIVAITRKQLIGAPGGRLRMSKSHGNLQFYHCMEGDNLGKYIGKDSMELVQKLAQKPYNQKVLKLAEKRLLQITKILKDYEEDEIEQLYLKESENRKQLICPIEQTWEQKKETWKSEKYQGKDFQEGMPVILTEKGERVRSKSEKIMADYFYRHGIEYKYERPLYLKGMGTIYPDFTFLSKETGEEIYWEHNGKCDDTAYARKMVRKINAYENNGIFPGERLILTYETEQTILNTNKIEQLVRRYL